jgi:hypothetical protein
MLSTPRRWRRQCGDLAESCTAPDSSIVARLFDFYDGDCGVFTNRPLPALQTRYSLNASAKEQRTQPKPDRSTM